MKKTWIIKLLAASLALTMTVPLFSCQDPDIENVTDSSSEETSAATESSGLEVSETESESATIDGSDSSSESESESESENETESLTGSETNSESETETTPIVIDDNYSNGEKAENAGYEFDDEAFAGIEHPLDESKAIDKSAAELLEMLASKSCVEGKVYRVKEQLVLASDTKYYGNNSAVIAEGGILVKDVSEMMIKELIIKGSIKVENSSGITLFRLDITADGTAIDIDGASYDTAVKSCRIHATDTALKTAADLSAVYQNYFSAKTALLSSADDLAVQNNIMVAENVGIDACGAYTVIKNNTVTVGKTGVGIRLSKGSYNSMAALNIINDVQRSIDISEGYNCVILLNSAVSVYGSRNTNLYVIENSLGGIIELVENDYLICDNNSFIKDDKQHHIIKTENQNFNGNDLHDADARLEAGADEALLPHTNKDLFLGMPRRGEVRDLTVPKSYTFGAYIRNMAKDSDIVIVPPGAYSSASTVNLQSTHANTKIYAYGVCQETTKYICAIDMGATSNINILGLTMSYADLSSGQAHVLKKLGSNQLLMISSAGFGKDFGATDTSKFVSGGSGVYLFRPDSMVSWTELGEWGSYKIVPNDKGEIFNDDGTFTILLTGKKSAAYYELIEEGEIFACRLNDGDPATIRTVNVSSSSDILLKDTVIYGYAEAMAVIIGGTSKDVEFYRHHNSGRTGAEIGKEEYDHYSSLEEKYGVDLDISIDSESRYRGADARIGSIDAAHVLGATEGLTATSTLFENACDDASNQRGDSSCLHKVIDNGDGTSTIVYKANAPTVYYNMYKDGRTSATGIETRDFAIGDRIFIYAGNGKILCDTTVLSATEKYQTEKYVMFEEDYEYGGQTVHWVWSCYLYKVTVKTGDLNMSALEGYDLETEGKDSTTMENKIIVDNMSRNSMGITFDNVMVRNNRGRIMLKTRDVTVKNCTFTGVSYAAIVMSVESTWGESSVAQDVVIKNCVFDKTSQTFNKQNDTKFAAIAIEGLGSSGTDVIVTKDSIPAKNITIEGNIFRFGETDNNFYVSVWAAQNIKILNNTFEARLNDSETQVGRAILIKGCLDIEISGNTYSSYSNGDMTKVISAQNYINLYGSDTDGFEKDSVEAPK